MPFPGTPSPFRLSRRQPSTRRSAGPQFANSPRFLLSQSTPQKKCDDLEIEDDDEQPSAAPVARTPAQLQSAIPPRRRREAIEDSDDGDLTRDTTVRGSRGHEPIDDAIDGTPPGEPETPGLLDAEFDALFTPVRDNNKRRRLSAGERPTPEDKLNYQSETMPSSPPELLQQRVHKTPAPRPVPKGTGIQAISSASAGPIPSGVSTPGSIKTPFRSKPRFMFAAKKPPSSQTPFKADTHTASQPTSPPERRKPTFVLPRSPSPNAAAEDVPVPFSPSSRTLHRRGRRSGVPGYTPGGMAAEVRSWILEVGSKREHAVPSRTTVHASGTSFEDLSQYLVAARVVHASQTALSSSGALAFIQAESVSCPTGERESSEHINVMAMGPPRSKPDSGQLSTRTRGIQTVILRAGDLVGIHRGLAWEVEFLEFQALGAAHGLRSGASERDDQESRKQRWLVAMEWDLIQVAD